MRTKFYRFTLIELLVVIAIIAVLAGLLLPAIASARDGARRSKARTEMKMLQTAISMWDSDYGSLPVPAAAKSGTPLAAPTVDTDLSNLAYDQLMWMLQNYKAPGEASPGAYENARRKRYLDIDNSKILALSTDPNDADDKRPFYTDPWSFGAQYSAGGGAWPGNSPYSLPAGACRYRIVMDYSYDGEIAGGGSSPVYETGHGNVAIWCIDKDRNDDKGGKGDTNSWR